MREWIWSGVAMAALAAASVTAQTPGGPAGRWIGIGNDSDSALSYDAATVVRRGGIVDFRLRAVLRPEIGGEMRSLVARGRLDCGAQTLLYSTFQRFDAAGRPMPPLPSRARSPEHIVPGGTQQRLYEHLCPASLRRPLPTPPPIMVVPSPRPPVPPIAPPSPPPPPPPPPGRSARAQWQTPPHALFTARDYPATAIRAEEQGRTQVRLAVTRNGRVRDCSVIASSGFAALDAATCRVLRERARFTPARDARGRRTEDSIPAAINWRIPD